MNKGAEEKKLRFWAWLCVLRRPESGVLEAEDGRWQRTLLPRGFLSTFAGDALAPFCLGGNLGSCFSWMNGG